MFNISLRQLATIRSLASTGRVNRSAQSLGLTPPAITLQLRQVEAEVGAMLFNRTHAGMTPTPIGHAVIAAAEDMEERMRALNEEVRFMVSGRSGKVRLGVVSTAKYFIPSMIAQFGRTHPEIDILLLVGNRAETIERLHHQELDIAVMGRPPQGTPVTITAMGDHPFVIVAAPDHPLVGETNIPKDKLVMEKFLLRERGSGTRNSLELYFADIPEKVEHPGIDMGSNESIKQAVMAGLGIALLSAHTVAAEVGQGWLRVLDVVGMPITRQWYCVTPARRSASGATRLLRDYLSGEGAALLPDIGAGPTKTSAED